MARALGFSSVLCALGVAPTTAFAQPKPEVSAEQLFQEGRQLMQQPQESRIKEGCAKLAQSQALDPASGTLLNLGECYEKLKQFSTAFTTYKQARELAREGKRQDWLSFADEKMRAIEPKIPRIRFVGQKPAGSHVELDGRPLEGADPGISLRVDPGEHRIVVVIGERELSSRTVQAVEATVVDVSLDAPSKGSPPPPPPPPPVSGRESGPVIAPAVWVLGVSSVVSFAVGGVLLGVREGQVSSMISECGKDGTVLPATKFGACSDRGSSADRTMVFSLVGFGLGAALGATAFVLHFSSAGASAGAGAGKDANGVSATCVPGLAAASCLIRF